jgi:hypothetical protein
VRIAAHCVFVMGNKVSVNRTLVTLGIHDVNDVSDETMKYQVEAEVFFLSTVTQFFMTVSPDV